MSAFQIAHLDNDQAKKIHELESELDVCILALEPGLDIAQLNEEQLRKVKQVESETGVTLVVYKKC
jgi:hypothetical protein